MEERNQYKYSGLTPHDGSMPFVVGVIATLILSVALGLVISDQNTVSLVYSFVSQTCFALLSFGFAFSACKRDCPNLGKYTLNTLHSLGFTKRTNIGLLGISAAFSVFSILAFLPISTLVDYLFSLTGFHLSPGYADYTSSPAMLVICIFALCIFPAFGEEMLMRGAMLHGLRMKGTVFAITMTSLIFALLHGSPTQFIHQFLIGIIMAYLVCLTDCLWHSIIFHFLNNFIVILYEYIYTATGATFAIPLWAYFVMFVVGMLGVVGLLILFTKLAVKNTNYKQEKQKCVEQFGKVKGTIVALFNTSEYKYKSYDKAKFVMFYVALGLVVFLWVFNTIAGWIL